jgi:hypothetical protein
LTASQSQRRLTQVLLRGKGNRNTNSVAENRAGLNGEARPYGGKRNGNGESQKRRLAACATGLSLICTGALNSTERLPLTYGLRSRRLSTRLKTSNFKMCPQGLKPGLIWIFCRS